VLVVTAGALTLAQLAKSATRNKELEEYFGRTMSIQSQTESTFLDSTHLLGNCITGNCDTTAPLRKALQTAIQTSQSAGMAFSMLVPPAHGEYTQELLAAAREWNDKVAPALKRHSENILAVVEDRSQPALDRLRAMLPELQKDEAEEKAVNQRLRAAMRTFFDKNNMKVPEQFAVFIAGMQSFSDLGQLTFLIHDIEQAIQMEAQRSR
jgi:hypothetical protein